MIQCNVCTTTIKEFDSITSECPNCQASNKERILFIFLKKNKLVKNNNFLNLGQHLQIENYCRKNTGIKNYFLDTNIQKDKYKHTFFNVLYHLNFLQTINKNREELDEIRRIMVKSGSIITVVNIEEINKDKEIIDWLQNNGFFIRLHITQDQFNQVEDIKYDKIRIMCSKEKNKIHGIGNIFVCECVKKIDYMNKITKW